ncbi:pyrroline-5-carboxylate reductase [Thioalkalivibrio sp.]|uniref:pyrroline-5-carboxylate reductase n=1 Tax=Thioalkalivibrio sp. TaxID=2093813 RepID=UPI003975C133
MNQHPLETGLVGGGNMGQALIAGLIRGGMEPAAIGIAEPDTARAAALRTQFPGLALRTAAELAAGARTLVLAVKPQVFPTLLPTLAGAVAGANPLVISVAAGISTAKMAEWLGAKTRIIRAMPNTPALIGAGIAGLFANGHATAADRETAERLLGAVGKTLWVRDEEQMHAVTATSGSGPAYVFLLIEAMTEAAEGLGLDRDRARQLSLATVAGAARLAAGSTEGPGELRARVTSPGGTTERAIAVFEEGRLRELVAKAMQAAAARSRELGG